MNFSKEVFGLLLVCIFWASCYSFKGVSIPADTNTFEVKQFELASPNAPADIAQRFTVELINKIRNESKLKQASSNPDVVFDGQIVKFNVTPINPQPDAQVSNNRFTISIKVNYTPPNPDAGWTETFKIENDFPATQNFLDIQDQLIEEAFFEITDQVFNKAFTNW